MNSQYIKKYIAAKYKLTFIFGKDIGIIYPE